MAGGNEDEDDEDGEEGGERDKVEGSKGLPDRGLGVTEGELGGRVRGCVRRKGVYTYLRGIYLCGMFEIKDLERKRSGSVL